MRKLIYLLVIFLLVAPLATKAVLIEPARVAYDDTDFAFVSGKLTVINSGIDHDATTNFVANEHIDWTNTSANFKTSSSDNRMTRLYIGGTDTAPLSTMWCKGNTTYNYAWAHWEGPDGGHAVIRFKVDAADKNVGFYFTDSSGDKWLVDRVAGGGSYFRFHSYSYGGPILKMHENGDVYLPSVPSEVSDEVDLQINTTSGLLSIPSSSARFKKGIRNVNDSDIDFIHNLRPRAFKWKSKNDGIEYIGLIAEEVKEIDPRLVTYGRIKIVEKVSPDVDVTEKKITYITDYNTPSGVKYKSLIVPMLNEIQKLRAELDQLKAEVERLKK